MKRKPRERLTRRSREIETRRAATREGQPEGPTSYKRERLGGTLPSVCMLLSFLFFFRGRRGGEGFFFWSKEFVGSFDEGASLLEDAFVRIFEDVNTIWYYWFFSFFFLQRYNWSSI